MKNLMFIPLLFSLVFSLSTFSQTEETIPTCGIIPGEEQIDFCFSEKYGDGSFSFVIQQGQL